MSTITPVDPNLTKEQIIKNILAKRSANTQKVKDYTANYLSDIQPRINLTVHKIERGWWWYLIFVILLIIIIYYLQKLVITKT